MRPSLRTQFFAATAFWLFVTLLFIGQVFWMASQPGESLNLRTILPWQAGFYLWWIPFTVLVWRLTDSWVPSIMGWSAFLARHVGLLVLVSIAHSVLAIFAATAILGPPAESFGAMLIGQVRGRSYFEALIYAGVVASGHAMWLSLRWREGETQAARLEAELSAARLVALQQQVQPHFLFNSLHAIASLARDGRNAAVVQMIANLSDLLRTVTDNSTASQPLSAEVELAQRYLEIQQIRFGDRLRFSFEIAPDAMTLSVPTLTLQPLVDNAVRHGITPGVAGGHIRVRAARHGNLLQLTVDDDGVGVAEGWTLDTASGTGIRNLRSRLAILYGTDAFAAVHAKPDGGFSVVVTMPAVMA